MSFIPAAALGIFAGTLLLVVTRPKNLAIGWSALLGAAACGAFGLIHWSDVVAIWPMVWNATATLIATIITSSILDDAGLFTWASLHIARTGTGPTSLLFTLIVLLGEIVRASCRESVCHFVYL